MAFAFRHTATRQVCFATLLQSVNYIVRGDWHGALNQGFLCRTLKTQAKTLLHCNPAFSVSHGHPWEPIDIKDIDDFLFVFLEFSLGPCSRLDIQICL